MGEHKGTITLVIAVLVLFGIWIFFGNNYIKPLITDIGESFKSYVDKVFDQTDQLNPPTVED